MRLVLGSSSPRRAALLSQLGLSFDIMAPSVDESVLSGEQSIEYVTRMSDLKYSAISKMLQVSRTESLPASKPFIPAEAPLPAEAPSSAEAPPIIVAADTVVVLEGEILGKPTHREEGYQMLSRLSGNEHRVLTSVTLGRQDGAEEQFVVETIVRFRTLMNSECESYWDTGEPQDKAGGYGIQGVGAMFIESIDGSYTNVVGLPLTETATRLQSFGISILG